jgi:hypothetical protein
MIVVWVAAAMAFSWLLGFFYGWTRWGYKPKARGVQTGGEQV